MKKGFFSHQLCCGCMLHNKYLLYLTMDNRFHSVVPFRQEVSLTTFCEGLLLVVSPVFESLKTAFTASLLRQLDSDEHLTVGEAVISNPVYLSCLPSEGEKCSVYTITSIDWTSYRLYSNKITLIKII